MSLKAVSLKAFQVGRAGRGGLGPAVCCLILALLGSNSQVARAQIDGRAVPRQSYFVAFQPFRRGEYRDALRAFRSAANSGINTGAGRWVDSICYSTMIGECLYHLGDIGGALDQYDAALRLMIVRHGWLQRIQLPPTLPPNGIAPAVPWGPMARGTVPGGFPDTMLSLQGTDVDAALRQGGTVAPAEFYPVRVMEIMRCIGLALQRRREILGPLAPQLPLTGQLVSELSRRQVPANHWMQSLIDVQLGIAKSAAGDVPDALALLQRSAAIGGRMDHPLSSLALLEIGHLAWEQNQLDLAQRSFFEATFPAVAYDQPDAMERGFVAAARVHALKGEATLFPPLVTAVDWVRSQNLDRAYSALLIVSAHNAALAGQPQQASAFLSQARRAMGRSDLAGADFGARWQYESALVTIQAGNLAGGAKLLQDALRPLRATSNRLFQIELANKLYAAKEISPRVAQSLFAILLREPTADDWRRDPAETLLLEVTPHEVVLENWLEICIERGEVEAIVYVSDLRRRHRFFNHLELGGRLLALRWVLDAPELALSAAAIEQRRALFAKFPQLQALLGQLTEAQVKLAELPLEPQDPDQQRAFDVTTKELIRTAEAAEAIVHELALRPEPASREFPPLRTLDELQGRLQPGQAVLALTLTRRGGHALLITSTKQYKHWQLTKAGSLRGTLVSLMREIGNYDQNQVLAADRLTSENWKTLAAQLADGFAEGLNAESLAGIDELAIVPDGFFWYLPFEMLQIDVGGERKALIDLARVRYAPTIGLAVPDGRPAETSGPRVIVQGRLFSRDNQNLVAEAAEQLRDQHPRSVVLRKRLPVATQYLAPSWQQLVVLDDIELNVREPLGSSAAQIDQGKPGSTLAEWLSLPFGAPDVVVLPGYRTLAEDGLRGRADGDELFLAACGVLGTGARTVVLARWRTGGRMSMEILREFLQELPQESPSAAWQRTVLLARSAELDPGAEPRLKDVQPDRVPTADHPFFWAGYLMLGAR